jgi:hypothetical protein
MLEIAFMKLSMYFIAIELSVSVHVSLLSILGSGSVNTFPLLRKHATIEELFHASFSVRPVSYKRRVV